MRRETHLEITKVELGSGRDNVCLVHPPEGNTVDLVGSSDQQQPTRQLLQEHHTLPPEATREEDEDGTRSDGGTELRGLGGFPALLGLVNVLRGVEAGRLLSGDDALRAVLLAANGHLLRRGGLSRSGLLGFFLALKETTAGVDGRAGEATDAGGDFLVAGHLAVQRRSVSTRNESKGSPCQSWVHPSAGRSIQPNPQRFHPPNLPQPTQGTRDVHPEIRTARNRTHGVEVGLEVGGPC